MKTIPILCLVLFLSSSMASAHHLNLTTWCEEPCLVKSHTSPLQQLVKQLFAELDIEVTIDVKPAERSLIDANAGLTDGEFARVDIIGDIYPNLIRVDVPLYQMDIAVFTNLDSMPTSQSWRSLDAYSLGYVIGWKIVEENVAGFSEVIGVKDADTMFKLLNAGRFNTAVYGKLLGEKLIEENELLNVRLSHVLTTQPMYLYIHQKHKHLLPQLNELITKLNASA